MARTCITITNPGNGQTQTTCTDTTDPFAEFRAAFDDADSMELFNLEQSLQSDLFDVLALDPETEVKCLRAPADSSDQLKNLRAAENAFRKLESLGLVKVPFKSNFEGGLDNQAFSFTFEDRSVPGTLAQQDIFEFTGATVFRGGAATFFTALDTVAHEIFHLEPFNMTLWKSGKDFKQLMAQRQATRFGSRTVETFKENICKE